jgi:hypothetical protein
MTMLRSLVAVAALFTVAACSDDDDSTTGPNPLAAFSIAVQTPTAARAVPTNGSVTVTIRNITTSELNSGTFCASGGFQQQVANEWVTVTRADNQVCTLPARVWAPNEAVNETIDLGAARLGLQGSAPYTVRAFYNTTMSASRGSTAGGEAMRLTSEPFTITAQ